MLWNERVEVFTLTNGLTVYHQYYPEAVAGVVVLYRVGSAYEEAGKTGMAHILEHLMFNGTKRYGPFSNYVEAWGGYDNAFTDRDITLYHTVVPADRLPDVLRLEADRMENLTFNNFGAEKSVILEEYLLSENEDDERLWTEVFAHLWPDSPYSNPVSGWPEDVSGLTLSDLEDFYGRYYTPNNALLVVVSPYTLEEVRRYVREAFEKISAGSGVRRPPHGPPPYRWFKSVTVKLKRPRRFVLAFRLGRPSLKYNTVLNVFTRVLDLERSSPLWPLVEEGHIEMFNVRNYEYEGGNVVAVIGEVSPGSTVPSDRIMDVLTGFVPRKNIVDRVKRMFKSEFVFSYEEAESVSINVALTAYLYGEVPSLSASLRMYDEVSLEDLIAVRRDLGSAPSVLVMYG